MASKVLVFAFLCVALVAFVQGAPQYEKGDAPTYDEGDFDEEQLKPHSSSSNDDQSADEEEFDPSLLSEDFGTAQDPGRNPEFLKTQASSSDDHSTANADSSAESDE